MLFVLLSVPNVGDCDCSQVFIVLLPTLFRSCCGSRGREEWVYIYILGESELQ